MLPTGTCGGTFTEEHVPDAQHAGPRQRAREDAHEPLGHVENGVDLELLEVTVGHGTRASQQREEDLAVQLDRFLPEGNEPTWVKNMDIKGASTADVGSCSPVLRCSSREGTSHISERGTRRLAVGHTRVKAGQLKRDR